MQTITLDWLELFGTCTVPNLKESEILSINDRVAIGNRDHGTSFYKNLYEIYLDSEPWGQIQLRPRVRNRDEKESILKVYNNILYENSLISDLKEVAYGLSSKFSGVTRLDIAIDNTAEIVNTLNMYLFDAKKDFCKVGRANTTLLSKHNTQSENFEHFVLGSMKSDKYVTIYNKSKELLISNKNYISSFWAKNGLQNNGNIYRTELRLKSNYIKSIMDFDLLHLDSLDFLKALFFTGSESLLDFRKNDNNVISRCTPLDLIDFAEIKGAKLDRCTTRQTSDLYKAKLSIHLLFKKLCKSHNFEQEIYFSETLKLLVTEYELKEWYEAKREEWKHEYKLYSQKNIKDYQFSLN